MVSVVLPCIMYRDLLCSVSITNYFVVLVLVDKLSSKQIQIVREKYLDGNEGLSVEKVTRSSKACGPLYQWAESQIKYSTIYNSIQPLREEVEKLEHDAKVANDEKERLESEVAGLESSIANYKSEYAT